MPGFLTAGFTYQGGGVGIAQLDDDVLIAQCRQRIEQVVHVEANGQVADLGIGLDLFLRFFLLGVVRADLQLARRDFNADAAVLLVGQDGRTLQRRTQGFAVHLHFAVGADRDHRFVIRETAIDQLRGEGDIVALDPHVAAADFQLHFAVAALEQALQLGHALARHDDLALGAGAVLQRRFAQRQAVAVGGHAAQQLVAQVEQQAVEVIAHVLLRHRERGALDQFLQCRFGHRHALGRLDLVHGREIVCRQRGQGEAAAPGLHGDLLAGLRHGHAAAVGQGADDLEQLACRNRGFAVLRILDRDAGDHFHFQVGTGQRQLAALYLDQEVGQNRKGLTAFNHVDDLGQRLEEGFALQCETHVVSCPYAFKDVG